MFTLCRLIPPSRSPLTGYAGPNLVKLWREYDGNHVTDVIWAALNPVINPRLWNGAPYNTSQKMETYGLGGASRSKNRLLNTDYVSVLIGTAERDRVELDM